MRTSLLLAFHIASTADAVSMEVGAEGSVRRTGVVRRHVETDGEALVEDAVATTTAAATPMATTTTVCEDDPDWKDARSYTCAGWKGYQCETARNVYGYTAEEEQAILTKCKKSCKKCGATVVKNAVQTSTQLLAAIESNEVASLAAAIQVAHTLADIVPDDQLLLAAKGLYAADRALQIANDAMSTGTIPFRTIKDQLDKAIVMAQDTGMLGDSPELKTALEGYTLASTALDVTFESVDKNGDDKLTYEEWNAALGRLHDGVKRAAIGVHGMIGNGTTPTFTKVQRLFTGASMLDSYTTPECLDNLNFKDQKGYKCTGWKGYECKTAMQLYGYTNQSQQELIQNCRKSCNMCEHDQDVASTLMAALETPSISGLKTAITLAHTMGVVDDDILLQSAMALYAVDRGLETAQGLLNGSGVDIWTVKDELDKAVNMAKKLGVARDNTYARSAIEIYSVVGTADKFAFNHVDVNKDNFVNRTEWNNLFHNAVNKVVDPLLNVSVNVGAVVAIAERSATTTTTPRPSTTTTPITTTAAGKPACVGDAARWSTQFGNCASYGEGSANNAYCHEDADLRYGGLAKLVCKGCGHCA